MLVKLAKAWLVLGALVFIGIGAGFLIMPERWARTVEILLPTAVARTDIRATYGGFDLAFGVFLTMCAFRSDWLRPGIWALGLAGLGFGGGRLIGLLVEGVAAPLMRGFLALELLTAVIAFALLRRLRGI